MNKLRKLIQDGKLLEAKALVMEEGLEAHIDTLLEMAEPPKPYVPKDNLSIGITRERTPVEVRRHYMDREPVDVWKYFLKETYVD